MAHVSATADAGVRISYMHIEVVTTYQKKGPLSRNWDAVYDADPEAQFFLSWTWISHYLDAFKGLWLILAAKPSAGASEYIAFFPIKVRTEMTKDRGFHNEIAMASNFGTYTGFICAPEFQREAIPAFAKFIKHHFRWAKLRFENLLVSDERLQLFLREFGQPRFSQEPLPRIDNGDNVNQYVCPYATLPDTWEEYLETKVSSNTRQKMKRFLKKIDTSTDFRITQPEAATVERDINILLNFWNTKWGPKKGRRLPSILRTHRTMLLRCFADGALYLPVLWQGDKPLGALGNVVDRKKRSMLFIIGARDESFNNPPPGFVLHAHSIRYAIDNGFKTYDFLNGNEPYKYAFASEEHQLKHFAVITKSKRNLGEKLDSQTLPDVLQRAAELQSAGRLAEAERGYRQILAVDPRYGDALYWLGKLLAQKGNHSGAKRLFKELVAAKPRHFKAWYRLGRTYQRQSDLENAVQSYEKVLELAPGYRDVPARLAELTVEARAPAILAARTAPHDQILASALT